MATQGPVERATRRSLRRLKEHADPGLFDALSAGAVALAKELDAGAGLSAAAVHRELRTTLEALAPKDVPVDGELAAALERIRRASTPAAPMGDTEKS